MKTDSDVSIGDETQVQQQLVCADIENQSAAPRLKPTDDRENEYNTITKLKINDPIMEMASNEDLETPFARERDQE